ncbi:MAG TPA: nuclear transport factor 2 family protein [Mycobacteriales bacterium]|jgi:ketosteroid isomerase-like protein|nr:nuclear transport factor 2 family protein [Mycobacteriales bacterium]
MTTHEITALTDSDWPELLDRLRIEAHISQLGRCLDERDFEGLRGLFTEDAMVRTPGGTAVGHDALVDQARQRHSADEGIQHLITNLVVEVAGDRASVRANLLVSFARSGATGPAPFQLGEVYRFQLRQTGEGWRIAGLSSAPTWSVNPPAGVLGGPTRS